MFLFKKLVFKIIFFVVMLFAISTIIYATIFIQAELKQEQETLLNAGLIFAELSAPVLYQDYLTASPGSVLKFEDKVRERLKINTDVSRTMLLSTNGKILFDTNDFSSGADLESTEASEKFINDKTTLDLILKNTIQTHTFFIGDEQFTQVVVPIIGAEGGHLFSMSYILSYESFEEKKKEVFKDTILLLLPLFLFAVGSGILLAFSVTNPINKILKSAKKISEGDFSEQVEVKSRDEIGRLGEAFNSMATSLRNSYEGLQEKVKEKTEELSKSLIELEKENKDSEDAKRAMINLLEDSRALEEELKIEKEGVEKKVLERTAEVNEEKIKLQASIASLKVGFIMTDKKNNIVIINQAAREILCTSVNSPLLTIKECTLEHIEEELKGAIDLKAFINQSISEKKTLLLKELAFENRFVKIFISPILEETEAIGAVLLVDDITEAKIMERSKDEFFSIASHELRTPLTAIRGNTSLIKQFYSDKLKDDKDLSEMVDDIYQSSVRLIEIVNDFLDTSRLEVGKMEFKKEHINLAEMSQDVIKEYQTTGSLKMLYLNFVAPTGDIPDVVADKDRTRQIMVNLIGNAVKYTEKGGVTISVHKNGNFVEFLVADTGKGISTENQRLLFRKFQQASDNLLTRDINQSTGLGLYISKMMAEGMGGKVELKKSEIDVGSTFCLSLPIGTRQEVKIA